VRADAADRRALKEFELELAAAAAGGAPAAAGGAPPPSQGWDAGVALIKRVFVRPGANGVAEVMVVFTVDRTPELTRMRLRLKAAALSGGGAGLVPPVDDDDDDDDDEEDDDGAPPAPKRFRLDQQQQEQQQPKKQPLSSSLSRHFKAALDAVRRYSMPADGRRPAAKWSEALLALEKDVNTFSTFAHFALALSGAVQSDDRVVQVAVQFFAQHHCKIAKCEAKLARLRLKHAQAA